MKDSQSLWRNHFIAHSLIFLFLHFRGLADKGGRLLLNQRTFGQSHNIFAMQIANKLSNSSHLTNLSLLEMTAGLAIKWLAIILHADTKQSVFEPFEGCCHFYLLSMELFLCGQCFLQLLVACCQYFLHPVVWSKIASFFFPRTRREKGHSHKSHSVAYMGKLYFWMLK